MYIKFVGGLLLDNDWALVLEDSFLQHLQGMQQAVSSGDHSAFVIESERPFCGCEVCWMREIWAFLFPKVIAAYKTGKIRVQSE